MHVPSRLAVTGITTLTIPGPAAKGTSQDKIDLGLPLGLQVPVHDGVPGVVVTHEVTATGDEADAGEADLAVHPLRRKVRLRDVLDRVDPEDGDLAVLACDVDRVTRVQPAETEEDRGALLGVDVPHQHRRAPLTRRRPLVVPARQLRLGQRGYGDRAVVLQPERQQPRVHTDPRDVDTYGRGRRQRGPRRRARGPGPGRTWSRPRRPGVLTSVEPQDRRARRDQGGGRPGEETAATRSCR